MLRCEHATNKQAFRFDMLSLRFVLPIHYHYGHVNQTVRLWLELWLVLAVINENNYFALQLLFYYTALSSVVVDTDD